MVGGGVGGAGGGWWALAEILREGPARLPRRPKKTAVPAARLRTDEKFLGGPITRMFAGGEMLIGPSCIAGPRQGRQALTWLKCARLPAIFYLQFVILFGTIRSSPWPRACGIDGRAYSGRRWKNSAQALWSHFSSAKKAKEAVN